MITFICLFFPPVLSVFLYEKIQKIRLDLRSFFGYYCLDVVMVNLICFMVKHFVLNTASDSMADLTPAGAMNYLVLALAAAVVMAFICVFAKKNVKISKEVADEEYEAV
ncbi:MAG: hypothetical protein J6C98_03865 [Oscillospiraceae bacterium]|nr:hypothetical protein [Oscillospiraceae bacterium]